MATDGDVVAAIVAAGCGYPGDETAETVDKPSTRRPKCGR